jgi:hypothetical protein
MLPRKVKTSWNQVLLLRDVRRIHKTDKDDQPQCTRKLKLNRVVVVCKNSI